MNRIFSHTQRGAIHMPSMTVLLGICLTVALIWAATFEIDQTVRAQGQIIPSARTQVIQAADGGVLSRLLVHEGQSVSKGQVLAVLESERPQAAYAEGQSRQAALVAALERAQAEASGRTPSFRAPFGSVQRALYEQRKRSMEEEIAVLNQGLRLAEEELEMSESLLRSGDISRLEVMRAKRQVSELQGKISAVRNRYLQEARQEAAKLSEELASNRYKLEERENVLGHTELASPVSGIVKHLRINTIGGVLRAGDELMQISPTDGGMVIEARINPADIGQLQLNLPVTIKLDAFDFATFGSLRGTLYHISPDTLTEQAAGGQTSVYYRAHIRISDTHSNPKLANVELKPGMTAVVDIQTSRRTILRYLVNPVVRAFDGAFSER